VLLVHDGTPGSSDVLEWLVTMLSADVALDLVCAGAVAEPSSGNVPAIDKDRQWAEQLGRTLNVLAAEPQIGPEIVRMGALGRYDVIVLPAPSVSWDASGIVADDWFTYVLHHAAGNVFVAVHPAIPREIVG
jgi:hypothetical protein